MRNRRKKSKHVPNKAKQRKTHLAPRLVIDARIELERGLDKKTRCRITPTWNLLKMMLITYDFSLEQQAISRSGCHTKWSQWQSCDSGSQLSVSSFFFSFALSNYPGELDSRHKFFYFICLLVYDSGQNQQPWASRKSGSLYPLLFYAVLPWEGLTCLIRPKMELFFSFIYQCCMLHNFAARLDSCTNPIYFTASLLVIPSSQLEFYNKQKVHPF